MANSSFFKSSYIPAKSLCNVTLSGFFSMLVSRYFCIVSFLLSTFNKGIEHTINISEKLIFFLYSINKTTIGIIIDSTYISNLNAIFNFIPVTSSKKLRAMPIN